MFSHPAGVDIDAQYVFEGVRDGFQIVDAGYEETYDRPNYGSILKPKAKSKMNKVVKEELANGKVMKVSSQPQCVHAMGAIFKPDGSIRPITDCKRGKKGGGQDSINDHMETTCRKFSYVKIDAVTEDMTPSCWFGVLDIKSAYRSVAVRPEDRQKQGFVWEIDGKNQFFVDCELAFGLKCAPYIFTKLTEFVLRCMDRRGIQGVYGYLDDFLVMGYTQEECRFK